MAREFKDRVQDTSATTGTGPFTLDSAAIAGFRTFGAAHTVGATLEYAAGLGSDWEVGLGTLTDATHLARTTVLASSNGGALVNFAAGSKSIFETISGASMARMLTSSDATSVSDLANTTPTDAHKLLLVDAGGLAYTGTVAALRTLFGGTAPTTDTTAPVFASGAALSSSNVTQVAFTLSWPAATDAIGVARYEYSLDAGSTWTNVGNVLTTPVTGRNAATTYACRVRALDAAGNASTALPASVTTVAASTSNSAPSMSGSLGTANVTANGYTMSWAAGTDPDGNLAGYDISTDGGTTWTQLGNVLSYAVTTAAANTPYNLRVRARDNAGLTSNVLTATVTTSAAVATPTQVAYQFNGPKFSSMPTSLSTGSNDYATLSCDFILKTAAGVAPDDTAVTLYAAMSTSKTVMPRSNDAAHSPNGNTYKSCGRVSPDAAYAGVYQVGSLATFKSYDNAQLAPRYLWITVFEKTADITTATPIFAAPYDGNHTGVPIAITVT